MRTTTQKLENIYIDVQILNQGSSGNPWVREMIFLNFGIEKKNVD